MACSQELTEIAVAGDYKFLRCVDFFKLGLLWLRMLRIDMGSRLSAPGMPLARVVLGLGAQRVYVFTCNVRNCAGRADCDASVEVTAIAWRPSVAQTFWATLVAEMPWRKKPLKMLLQGRPVSP